MNWEEIRAKYESSEITMKDLAEQYGVKPSTLRSRKNREGWQQKEASQSNKKNATQHMQRNANVATQKKKEEPPELVIENEDLTERQKVFCLLYLQYKFNATKAYQHAYDCGYNTARTNGNLLLTKADIKAEIHRLKAELQQETFANVKDLIAEYIKQAFSDMTDFAEFGSAEEIARDSFGSPIVDEETDEPLTYMRSYVHLKDSSEVDGSLIQEVKKGKDGVSVKLYDKQKAMDVLFKYFGADALREAQINKLAGSKEGADSKDWKQAVIEAANKRAVQQDEQ